jgi:hypothetical protein
MFSPWVFLLYMLFLEMVTVLVDVWALRQIDYGGTVELRDASSGGNGVQLP